MLSKKVLLSDDYGPANDGNFLIFHFCEFQNCSVTKVWKFLWKTRLFRIPENFAKKSLEISLGQKNCFWGTNRGIGVKNRGIRTFRIYGIFGNCSIPNFPNITKNDVKIEFLFSRKTCYISNSDSNIQVRVWYVGPQWWSLMI